MGDELVERGAPALEKAHLITGCAVGYIGVNHRRGVLGTAIDRLEREYRRERESAFGEVVGSYPAASADGHINRRLTSTSRKQPLLSTRSPSGEHITVRKMPPGRTSVSASGVVHGAGVNHLLMCSLGPHRPDHCVMSDQVINACPM